MRLWHHRFKDSLWYAYSYVYFRIDFALSTNCLFVVQAATHLKGLAEKAKLNEKHVRIARIYKAKVATLTSERTELQGRAQRMSEEMERLKSDLKHTSSARARAESREVEVRSSLTTTEGELRQLLIVSTRNTSRSNANPTRMPDPPGDADSRPPGLAEAIQANTNEVEALLLVNQRLIEEIE